MASENERVWFQVNLEVFGSDKDKTYEVLVNKMGETLTGLLRDLKNEPQLDVPTPGMIRFDGFSDFYVEGWMGDDPTKHRWTNEWRDKDSIPQSE
jgi:hypothetical protein